MRWLRSPWILIFLLVLCAIGLKIWLLSLSAFPFNSDEAVVGLMARHILEGERPTFFYGQAYMGSLDAWLVSAGFALWGSQVWVIRLVQIILYSFTIIVTIFIGRTGFGSWKQGLLAGCFLAIPSVNTTLYTTVSLGGYGEALLIGSLGLWSGFWMLADDHLRNPLWMAAWSALLGLGLWANGLSLVFFLPMGVGLLWRLLKIRPLKQIVMYFSGGLMGFLLGSAPWWVYAIQHGFGGLLGELGGKAVAVEQTNFLSQTASHLVNLVILGFPAAIGLRPPWEVRWLGLPLLPLALVFWILVTAFLFQRKKQEKRTRMNYTILGGTIVTLAFLFILTPFGVDPSGRYFVPLILPFALGAAGWVLHLPYQKWMKAIFIGIVLIFNLWGNLDCALRQPPGITTQFYEPARVDHQALPELARFLVEQGELTGYTNYWVAYPLAFLSEEKLVFIPSLPYHPDLSYTPRDNRYPPYSDIVEQSGKTAYITTRNEPLDNLIASEFSRLKITWTETWIGEYHVFYNLSRPFRPGEIGLGGLLP